MGLLIKKFAVAREEKVITMVALGKDCRYEEYNS